MSEKSQRRDLPDGRPDPGAQIAVLFQELRRASKLAPDALQAHLLTDAATLQALEQGALDRLPPWPELERITRAYAALIGLDPLPIVQQISNLLYRPPPPTRPIKRAPRFVPQSRIGHVESDIDVRTLESNPIGPPPQPVPPPPEEVVHDPVIPEHGGGGRASPQPFVPDRAAQPAAPYVDPLAMQIAQARAAEGAGMTSVKPSAMATTKADHGPSVLKRLMITFVLLAICSGAVWMLMQESQQQVIGAAAGQVETWSEMTQRYLRALRELFR